ncbi:hypothetical protein VTL71DRAFT_12514, partial [Oculimacula yallundae]
MDHPRTSETHNFFTSRDMDRRFCPSILRNVLKTAISETIEADQTRRWRIDNIASFESPFTRLPTNQSDLKQ